MPGKKARAKAAKIEAAKLEPPITYKVKLDQDYCWTSLVLVSADAALDSQGNHDPGKSKKTVGSLTSRVVCRNDVRRSFWQSMQEPSQKTSALAFAIFDR
jgi:hypothetical protein